MDNNMQAPKVLKESKNKIVVDFERTSIKERLKLKYLSVNFVVTLIWKLFRFLLMLGVSYVIIYPFISRVASSIMSAEDFVDVTVKLIPKYPTLDTYKAIITDLRYFEAMRNTLLLSLSSALIQTFICSVIGYGFAKFKFKGSGLLFGLVIFTMIVPHSTLQLSLYWQFKYFDVYGIIKLITGKTIDLTSSLWPLAILSFAGLGFKNGLYTFMMRQFFKGVPDELEESAYIDGSGVLRTFIRIVLPLSVPMMITIFLFSFSWQWTDSFYTELFFNRNKMYLLNHLVGTVPKTLPLATDKTFAGASLFSAAIQNTIGLLIIMPIVVVYLFLQRYLVEGIERSGIVG